MNKKLDKFICKIKNEDLREFISYIFSGKTLDDFLIAPASRGGHHSYEGGLATHTLNVVGYAYKMSKHINNNYSKSLSVDAGIVIAGALLHDIGKINIYIKDTNGEYKHTKRSSLYHHISLGTMFVDKKIDEYNKRWKDIVPINNRYRDAILHIILSSHGRKSWSSPVTPQTIEAFIVHNADMLDSYSEKFANGIIPKGIYE